MSILLAFILLDFIVATIVAVKMGIFQSSSGTLAGAFNILFGALVYLALFAVPSLTAIAIWASAP